VLQIGIHNGQDFASGGLPASNHRCGQTGFFSAANDANFRESGGLVQRQLRGAIRTVVVDDDDFESQARHAAQSFGDNRKRGANIAGFLERGQDQAEVDSIEPPVKA